MANKSLLGNKEKPSPYVIRNYVLLNKQFERIFKLLDAEPSLSLAMREFLAKYKFFIKKKGFCLIPSVLTTSLLQN